MSAVNQGDKSERVVNVTVNNNTSSGTKCNSSLISICNEPDNRRPLNQVKPVSTTTAALVQAYLTLNDMASVTRSSDKNLCAPNNTMVTSTPLVSVAPMKEVKCDLYVKVINPDKKKEFSTYVLRDIIKEKISTP